MKKTLCNVRVLAAAAVLALLAAGSAWAQQLAPVNPAFARWMKDGGKEAAAARRAAARARGEELPSLGYVPEVADLSYLANLNDSLESGVGSWQAKNSWNEN